MKVTREVIITAARELFREKGYAGASMQDLANCIGLKKASLYARFPNKEALVMEVLDLTLEETFPRGSHEGVPWELAFKTVITTMANSLTSHKRCVGLHLAYGINEDTPIAKAAVKAFFQCHRERLSEILARTMPQEKAEVVASDALLRLEGATLLLSVFNETKTMDRVVQGIMAEARQAAMNCLLNENE